MRFHLAEAMTAITNYVPLAQAAEANGYAGYTIPDSLIYPEASDTSYSYTDDGDRSFIENKPFVEAFTLAMKSGSPLAGIGFFSLTVLFQLINLPVEFDASFRKALPILKEGKYLADNDMPAARSVLPNATEVKIVVSANVRAWRTMLELRLGEGAELEIRRMAVACLRVLQQEAPALFADFEIYESKEGGEAGRVGFHKV
jgi:hypothetical protein